MTNIKQTLHQYRKHMRGLYIVCQILGTIGFPIIEGFLINYLTSTSLEIKSPFFVIMIIIIILHSILAFALIFIQSPAPVFYMQLDEQTEKSNELESDNIQLANQVETSFLVKEAIISNCGVLDLLNNKDIMENLTYESIMDFLIMPWNYSRSEIWGYQSNSMFNFVLYWVKDGKISSDELIVKWRKSDDRIKRKDRAWKRGDGHIGRCWVGKETLISPANFCESPLRKITCQRDEDNEYYKSVLVTPIKLDNEVWGVFVVTSSTDAQFNEVEHGQAAEILGMLIAQGLSHCRKDKGLFAH